MLDPIDIPPDLEKEDVFLPLGPVKFSFRQVFLTVVGLVGWAGGSGYLLSPMLGLTMLPSLILGFPWVILCVTFAFVKIHRRPLDVFLSEKWSFYFGPRIYVARDEHADPDAGLHADLDRDHEAEEIQKYLDRPRVVR